MSETAAITPEMTMEEVMKAFPSAQRALFQRYHVGGCSACGFQPTDTLAQVCKDHNLLDVPAVLRHIVHSQEVDAKMQRSPEEVKGWLEVDEPLRLIDVRMPAELEQEPFELAEVLDTQNNQKYMELPKDTRIVFVCQNGERSLDVAAYFAGHGFQNVHALRGGVDAWRQAVGSRA